MATAVQRSFGALSGPARGMLWMTGAAGCYACVYAILRHLTLSLPIIEVVFLRAALAALFLLPWLARADAATLHTRQWPLYLLRLAFGLAAMLSWIYGLKHLALADATALAFTVPIFTVILAVAFLGEHVGRRRWAAVAAGFLGALIVIRPGVAPVSLAALAVVLSSLFFAANNVATKKLTQKDAVQTVVFYGFLGVVIASGGPTLYFWVTPGWVDVPWVLLLGVLNLGSQQCVTRAFAAADHGVVMPFHFLRLPLVSVIAYFAFAESPDGWTWLGAAVIFGSVYHLARREGRHGGRAAAGSEG